jgi:outer membrane receptor protein involved in Fe transport
MNKLSTHKTLLTRLLLITYGCLSLATAAAGYPSGGKTPKTPDSLHLNEIKINLSLSQATVGEALEAVSEHSGLGIVYDHSDLPKQTRITLHEQDISVSKALSHILTNTRLSFKEYNGNIVIVKRAPAVQAKQGTIAGILKDSQTDEPLIGAAVKVIGTATGTITDVNGRYSLKVATGVYQLAFSYISYEAGLLRDVRVEADKTTVVDYKLKESANQLQGIEIIGNRALSGNVVLTNEVSLIKDMKNSSLIVTGISAQQISRSVDQDAGDVARRLPGVAILNNFVNIRGMHERYNLTYLNGMVAPSAEADRRAFSYDLMPSNMIDKMTVYRSPAPELLADWAGGVIKIETKNTAIARQFEVNFSVWHRPGSNFEDYYTYEGGKNGWLGRDDGTQALPADFPALGEIPAGGFNDLGTSTTYGDRDESKFTAEQLAANAALGRQMYNKWNLLRARSRPDYRGGINYYDSWKLGKMRLSNLTSINTTQATQIIHQDFVPQGSGFSRENNQPIQGFDFKDTISQVMARWGVVQNLTLTFNDRHSIQLKGLYNQLGINETIVREGFGSDATGDNEAYQRRITYIYRSRAVLATQAAGSHAFGKKVGDKTSHQLNWGIAYAYAGDDIPSQRQLYMNAIGVDRGPSNRRDTMQYRLSGSGPGLYSINESHFSNNSTEKNYTYTLDYEKVFAKGFFVRAGFFNENKERIQNVRLVNILGLRSAWPLEQRDSFTEFNADEAFAPELYKDDGTGAFIGDNPFQTGSFDVDAKIYAGYAAVNVPLFNQKLNIYGGIRYEGQDLVMLMPGLSGILYNEVVREPPQPPGSPVLPVVDRYLKYWLPSVNASWDFSDKVKLRAAYGETLNRPNFREMMPTAILDPRLELVTRGNVNLVDARVKNFDLRWEYYPGQGEFISFGGFYKRLSNAIEPFIKEEGTGVFTDFTNTPKAVVYGLEAEVRKSFAFLPWAWGRNLSMIANAAVQRSEVEFQDGLGLGDGITTFDNKIRPLEGTSPYVVNVALYYDIEKWGTKLSALYNVLGQRLIFAGSPRFPETYELPRNVLDFTVRQRVNKYVELKAGVADVLNQPLRRYRDFSRDQTWNPSARTKFPFRDWMFQEFRPGSYYTVGVNVTF